MSRMLSRILAGIAISTLAGVVQATPINTALGLSIDSSGSINSSDYNLQIQAYQAAINDPNLLPDDGSVVVYINQFSSGVQTLSSARRISGSSDRSAIATDLGNATQLGSSTSIGAGIDDAASSLSTYLAGIASDQIASDLRAVIDVSTDGENNLSPSPTAVAANAVGGTGYSTAFDQINCLGIGSFADCGFIPSGSFSDTVNSFDGFDDALREKIARETTPSVPEPPAIGLFLLALGVIGIAAINRRRMLTSEMRLSRVS